MNKKTKRKILSFLVPPLGISLLRLIYFTCKVKFHGFNPPATNTIYVTWHGELLMTPFCYIKKQDKTRTVCVMTSPHFDGQLIGKIFQKMTGGISVEGSSSKDGAKALMKSIRVLKKPNFDMAISPDGPRGPRHSVAPGVVMLSQRLNIPIVTINTRSSSNWKFNTWDKMFLPKPFSKIDFYLSEPFYLDGLDIEQASKKVKDKLMENAHV